MPTHNLKYGEEETQRVGHSSKKQRQSFNQNNAKGKSRKELRKQGKFISKRNNNLPRFCKSIHLCNNNKKDNQQSKQQVREENLVIHSNGNEQQWNNRTQQQQKSRQLEEDVIEIKKEFSAEKTTQNDDSRSTVLSKEERDLFKNLSDDLLEEGDSCQENLEEVHIEVELSRDILSEHLQQSNKQEAQNDDSQDQDSQIGYLFNPVDDINFIGDMNEVSPSEQSSQEVQSTEFLPSIFKLNSSNLTRNSELDLDLLEDRSLSYQVDSINLLNYICDFTNFPKKRGILIDWLQEVSASLNFKRETLQQGVSIMDRYFACTSKVNKGELQLIGAVSLFIAHKIEEVKILKISHFISACNYGYTQNQFLETEKLICLKLNFELSGTPIYFWMNQMMIKWDEFSEGYQALFENDVIQFRKINMDSFCLFSSVCQYLDASILNIHFYDYSLKHLIAIFMHYALYESIDTQNYPSRYNYLEQIFNQFLKQHFQIEMLSEEHLLKQFAQQFFDLQIARIIPSQILIHSNMPLSAYENWCSQQIYNQDIRRYIGSTGP